MAHKAHLQIWSLVIKAYFDGRTPELGRNVKWVLERMKGVNREELVCDNDDLAVATAAADGY